MKKLFAPNTRAIGRPDGPPVCDAVPSAMIDGTPRELREDLVKLLGEKQVQHRLIDLVRYASDASPYRLILQVVVSPRNTKDIANILSYCRKTGRHATFRAAGTSLNGQSQSNDILIDVRRNWAGCKVEDGYEAGLERSWPTPTDGCAATAGGLAPTRQAAMPVPSAA
jgi:D-lactate dehydrogenase